MPPQPQSYSGIQVINGGVDLDQADAIKRMQSRYNLRVEISGHGGNYYVADKLKLMQGGDVVAEIPHAGPWLLMDVPPGRYTLLGDFGGTAAQARRGGDPKRHQGVVGRAVVDPVKAIHARTTRASLPYSAATSAARRSSTRRWLR